MAAVGLKAVYQWVVRTMMKMKGETGIVQTMPKKDIVEMNTQITAQRLMQNGIDPTQLKNADQVENAIIAIENRPKVQQGIRNTKSADVFDLKGKKIKDTKNIMGGEELPPGDPDLVVLISVISVHELPLYCSTTTDGPPGGPLPPANIEAVRLAPVPPPCPL